MRRFDTPAGPPGWAGQGADLVRIVDPTGRAIAWLAPGYGSNCVGYAVRRAGEERGGWRHILQTGSPRDLRTDPLGYGCAILGPGTAGQHLARHAAWRFIERDPTAATCTVLCGPEHPGDPFAIRLDLTARLEDATLHLALLATNAGEHDLPVVLGLHLNFAESFRGTRHGETADQAVTLASADGLMRIVVAKNEGTAGSIESTRTTVCTVEAPGAMLAPGKQIGIAVAIAVAWMAS